MPDMWKGFANFVARFRQRPTVVALSADDIGVTIQCAHQDYTNVFGWDDERSSSTW